MTSQTLKNPSVSTIPSPVGVDAAIQRLQVSLQNGLPWLEKSFGRAWTLPRTVLKEKRLEPMVYQEGKEYYPVLPNDALKSYSFFRVTGAREAVDYAANMNTGGTYLFRDPVDLIVWFDMKKIDPAKDYIFKEELIQDTLKILNRDPNPEVQRVYDDKVNDIFEGYTLYPEHRDLLMYPYGAFRIEMFLAYQFQCKP